MAKSDEVKKARARAKATAEKDLKKTRGFAVPPRKAMSDAKKASKNLMYPLPPYPGTSIVQLFLWGSEEWRKLGRWQNLALPFVIIVALLTWEKEKAMQEAYYADLDRAAIKRETAQLYGTFGRRPKQRKLLGVIPLPGNG